MTVQKRRETGVPHIKGNSAATIKMGAQELTKISDLELLRQQSYPGTYLHQETIQNQALTIHTYLAPLEVRMIEVEFEDNE